MIIAEKEFQVDCASCDKPAFLREAIVIHHGKGGCRVSYETHARCLTEENHRAALSRLDDFYEKVYELEQALNKIPLEDRYLIYGVVHEFQVLTIRPDACSPRTHVRIEAEIRAATMYETVTGEALPLEGLTVEVARASIQEQAAVVANRLKHRFNQGLF